MSFCKSGNIEKTVMIANHADTKVDLLWLYVAWQINISNGIATTKIVFSWTWKENKKNANEVFKSENRKFCWVGFSKSIRLDGKLAVRVAAVLIQNN